MRTLAPFNRHRSLAVMAITLGLILTGAMSATPVFAADPSISGVVEDTSSTPQAKVTVNVINPATASTVASTKTADDGSFSVSVSSGTYNVQLIPPSGSGLQSYLATGVSTDSVPLTIILKTAVVVQVQGTLQDSEGRTYTSAQNASIFFSSPLNPGTHASVDGSGNYSANLLADQNFAVTPTVFISNYIDEFTLPAGTLNQNQTYNVVMPVSTLTVSVRDASGTPVTGGKIVFGNSSISPLPGIPGSSAEAFNDNGTALDPSGNASLVVPNGITLQSLTLHFSNGLVLPFTLPAIAGDQHVFLIFSQGALTVDQPPVVTGTPDRPANANGWYNAPVTITWTSASPPGSPGPATTPPPVTLSTEGTNQKVTSAQSCDPVGDCATGSVIGISLDMTPPSVSVTGVTDGAIYTGGTTPTPACATTDALSGVAASATISVTNSGNSYTATCSGATDNAGNSAPTVQVKYQVLPVGWTTASLTDSDGNPIAGASVTFSPASGPVTNATTSADGTAGVALTPGTYSVTMNYATGYQTKTITVTADGPNTVTFATVAATVQITDPDAADLANATVSHAGNTGTFGPQTAVDSNGQVTFQVLPGTSTFTAYDANGYQTQTLNITGPATVSFATVPVTVQISDPDAADLANATVSHAGNTGTFGPQTAVDSNGQVTFQVLPGTSTFTAYDANGYQTQTLNITGPATVSFATVAVTVTVTKNGIPLTTALVSHAGNTGTFGPNTAVDSNGQVTFQVLPGTSTFVAWDGTAYQQQTITVTTTTSTTIAVP